MPNFNRNNLFHRLFWPALAAFACAMLWYFTLARAESEHVRAEQAVERETTALAEAYEQYVTRSVAQMDQITTQLKYSAEHGKDLHLLENMKSNGMFLHSAFVEVSIVDPNGLVKSSTHPAKVGLSFAASAFFNEHRNSNSSAMRIGVGPPVLELKQDVVLFSRRIDSDSDDFAGVVLLAVDARYFTTFVGVGTLGNNGILAVATTEGVLCAERFGAAPLRSTSSTTLLPADDEIWLPTAGLRVLPAVGNTAFIDGVSRVLAWRHSSDYRLVTMVGLSHEDAMAAANKSAQNGRTTAMIASSILLFLAITAAVLAARATVRIREQEEVRSAYRTATEGANEGFYMATAIRNRQGTIVDFKIVDCNERGAFFYGMERNELIGHRLSHIEPDRFGEDLIAIYSNAMEQGFHEDDRRMPNDNRLNIRWGHRRLVRVGNGLAVTLQDVSERKQHEAELERMANEDSLTGLHNRHWFLGHIKNVIQQARETQSTFAVLFVDLDEFKYVNDTQGHAVGDELLKAVAKRLAALLRPTDHLVRFGGDEFIVVITPAGSDLQIAAVARRIVDSLSESFAIADGIQTVGASIGISVFPRDGADAGTLIRNSDIAMYAGKSDGKRQFRFFDPALSETIQTRARLKHGLIEAIEHDQFMLNYQPRFDIRTGALLSMEALIRWRHPALGMISPVDFIPLAEQSGLIMQIGAMVIDKACRQLAVWRDVGYTLVPISVNVSPSQFERGGVRHVLEDALLRHGVPAFLLEVEITESAMMGDQDTVVAELAAIRALGIKLHIDDFGTGYSSLSQLQRLKMDVLKVDRAFTAELGISHEGKVFFQAIVSMAHALGMAVVAEGVENSEQLEILRELGCDEAQGYFIARPMPSVELAAMLSRSEF